MRMRHKPWARPELEACPFNINHPSDYYGKWQERFANSNPIHLELGCGKGTFIAEKASQNLDVNYIAVDIKSEVLVLAKRNIEQAYQAISQPINNVVIMSQDIERIDMILAPSGHRSHIHGNSDDIERIYINFCNPWHRSLQQKKRLTHTKQLEKYKEFLAPNAEIWFKTDDDALFEQSLEYFKDCGFVTKCISYDLHNSDFTENVLTEHERLFSSQGIAIKFLIAIHSHKNDNHNDINSSTPTKAESEVSQ